MDLAALVTNPLFVIGILGLGAGLVFVLDGVKVADLRRLPFRIRGSRFFPLNLPTRRLEATSREGAVSAPVTAPRGKGPVLEPSQAAGPTGVVAIAAVATPESLAARIQSRIAAAQGSPRDTSAEKDLRTGPTEALKVILKSRAEWFVSKEE